MIGQHEYPVVTLYGIPNCDTVKKARAWLDAHGIEHGVPRLQEAGRARRPAGRTGSPPLGWEKLLNRQGTTWRKLDACRRRCGTPVQPVT
jgi:arsenate reductase